MNKCYNDYGKWRFKIFAYLIKLQLNISYVYKGCLPNLIILQQCVYTSKCKLPQKFICSSLRIQMTQIRKQLCYITYLIQSYGNNGDIANDNIIFLLRHMVVYFPSTKKV